MSIFCGPRSTGEERDERPMGSKRREEAKQGYDSAPLPFRCEAIEECAGKRIGQDRRRKASPVLTPERRGGEVFLPPLPPAGECAPIDPELCVQLGGTASRDTMGHGRHQDDHDTEVHAATQKTQRRRGSATTTSVAITTEAEPPLLVGREVGGTTARLAGVVGLMESTAARAPRGARLIGEIPVERVEKVEEPGVEQQGMAH